MALAKGLGNSIFGIPKGMQRRIQGDFGFGSTDFNEIFRAVATQVINCLRKFIDVTFNEWCFYSRFSKTGGMLVPL